jgi:hypothetical protein
LRVLPTLKSANPLFQAARLGGIFGGILPNNDVVFCIHAYDASGNLSDCDEITEEVPVDEEPPLGRITGLVVSPTPTNLTAEWVPPAGGGADGYQVSYAPTGCILPAVQNLANEGYSPLEQAATNTTLTGLTVGQRYRVGVRASTNQISSELFRSAAFGDPTDADDDFMPDSWEAAFGIIDTFSDDDQDGLDNLSEYNAGTFPNEPVVIMIRTMTARARAGNDPAIRRQWNPEPNCLVGSVSWFSTIQPTWRGDFVSDDLEPGCGRDELGGAGLPSVDHGLAVERARRSAAAGAS